MDKKLLVDVRPFESTRQKIDESIKKLTVIGCQGCINVLEETYPNQSGRIYQEKYY